MTEEPVGGGLACGKGGSDCLKVPLKSECREDKTRLQLVTHGSYADLFSFRRDEERESSGWCWEASLMGKQNEFVVGLVEATFDWHYRLHTGSKHSVLPKFGGGCSSRWS